MRRLSQLVSMSRSSRLNNFWLWTSTTENLHNKVHKTRPSASDSEQAIRGQDRRSSKTLPRFTRVTTRKWVCSCKTSKRDKSIPNINRVDQMFQTFSVVAKYKDRSCKMKCALVKKRIWVLTSQSIMPSYRGSSDRLKQDLEQLKALQDPKIKLWFKADWDQLNSKISPCQEILTEKEVKRL